MLSSMVVIDDIPMIAYANIIKIISNPSVIMQIYEKKLD
jgi:hypothetical protein